MLHDERIFKNKFIYFYVIIFCFFWLMYFGYFTLLMITDNFIINENYTSLKYLFYILTFGIFSTLLISFICIFRESNKFFISFNIAVFLMILLHLIRYFIDFKEIYIQFIYFIVFLLGSGILVNVFRHKRKGNEIEEIGTHND